MSRLLGRTQETREPKTIDYVAVDDMLEEVEWSPQPEEDPVPLNRIQKMEKNILALGNENQQLRTTLEQAMRLMDEYRKRIDKLETVVLRKED